MIEENAMVMFRFRPGRLGYLRRLKRINIEFSQVCHENDTGNIISAGSLDMMGPG